MTRASFDKVLEAIKGCREGDYRILVAIAGPPGAGKSTIAERLAQALGPEAAVMPMDGFHLENDQLSSMGLLARKGAPETFDSAGFVALVTRLTEEDSVSYPTFDRKADCTVPDGGRIDASTRIVLIEGNYLLLNTQPWSDLHSLFDLTILLDVPRDVLKARLVSRWLNHGLSATQAEERAARNDMQNVDHVQNASVQSDFLLGEDTA